MKTLPCFLIARVFERLYHCIDKLFVFFSLFFSLILSLILSFFLSISDSFYLYIFNLFLSFFFLSLFIFFLSFSISFLAILLTFYRATIYFKPFKKKKKTLYINMACSFLLQLTVQKPKPNKKEKKKKV